MTHSGATLDHLSGGSAPCDLVARTLALCVNQLLQVQTPGSQMHQYLTHTTRHLYFYKPLDHFSGSETAWYHPDVCQQPDLQKTHGTGSRRETKLSGFSSFSNLNLLPKRFQDPVRSLTL